MIKKAPKRPKSVSVPSLIDQSLGNSRNLSVSKITRLLKKVQEVSSWTLSFKKWPGEEADSSARTQDAAKVSREKADSRHICTYTWVPNLIDVHTLAAIKLFQKDRTWLFIQGYTRKRNPLLAHCVAKSSQLKETWRIMSAVITSKNRTPANIVASHSIERTYWASMPKSANMKTR